MMTVVGSRLLLRSLMLLPLTGILLLAVPSAASSAPRGCGSLPSDNNVYMGHPGSCQAGTPSKATLAFKDGEQADLAMGPNKVFSQADSFGGGIVAMECQYSTGSGPGDPPNAVDYCDAQTGPGDFPFQVNSDGSFDYQVHNNGDLVTFFALPDKTWPHATIKCDTTHACVWYVGEDYQSFDKAHVFSNPFYVGAASVPGSPFPVWLVVVLVVAGLVVAYVLYRRFAGSGRRTPDRT